KAFSLKARERTRALSEREAELLFKINKGLSSATQRRLNKLIDKHRGETISAKELRELKKLTDQIEKSDAKRLGLLTELAHLRNVPLRKLIKRLGLKPVPHDSKVSSSWRRFWPESAKRLLAQHLGSKMIIKIAGVP